MNNRWSNRNDNYQRQYNTDYTRNKSETNYYNSSYTSLPAAERDANRHTNYERGYGNKFDGRGDRWNDSRSSGHGREYDRDNYDRGQDYRGREEGYERKGDGDNTNKYFQSNADKGRSRNFDPRSNTEQYSYKNDARWEAERHREIDDRVRDSSSLKKDSWGDNAVEDEWERANPGYKNTARNLLKRSERDNWEDDWDKGRGKWEHSDARREFTNNNRNEDGRDTMDIRREEPRRFREENWRGKDRDRYDAESERDWRRADERREEMGRSRIAPEEGIKRDMRGDRNRQYDRPRDPLLNFKRSLKMPLKNQHSMRKLVLAAASVPDVETVVMELGEGDGTNLEKLKEIITSPFSVDAGTRAFPVSFQRVILPLLTLVTNPRFEAVPFPAAVRRIYAVFYSNDSFILRVLDCIALMAKRRSLSDQGYTSMASMESDDDAWLPSSGYDVIEPVISLILIFLGKFTDAMADTRIPKWLQELESYFRTWDTQNSNPNVQRIRSKFQRAAAMLLPLSQENKTERGNSRRLNAALLVAMDPRIGPGNMRPQGPRHNNDFEDFRKISIIPTKDEIFCLEPAFLPKIESKLSHLPQGVDMLLDAQFRLMREDSIAAVRRGVSSFFLNEGLKALGKTGSFFRDRSGSVDLLVYRNVNIVAVAPSLWKGIGVVMKFSQPRKVETMNDMERSKYWSFGAGSRQLQMGSLVCLWLHAGKTVSKTAADQKIYFGVVSQRKKIDESSTTAEIEVRMLNHENIIEVTQELSDQIQNRGESILLQVRGHFFTSTESVLSALQQHTEATLPFVDCFAYGKATLRPPAYTTPDVTRFDLAHLVKNDLPIDEREEIKYRLRMTLVGDYKQLKKLLAQLEGKIILDPTQAQALAASLSHEVTLIQGPPGTGKTYLGIHIVRILLNNSSAPTMLTVSRYPSLASGTSTSSNVLTPIVCICYTNHALDQFLEGVVASGLPAENVVRVGGRSKSTVLQHRNLQDISLLHISPSESYRRGVLKSEAETLEIAIRDYTMAKQKKKLSFHDIKGFLKFHYEYHYYDICDRAAKGSNKHERNTQFFLADTESAVFEIWISGGDLKKTTVATKKQDTQPSIPLASTFAGLTIEGEENEGEEDEDGDESDEDDEENDDDEDDEDDEDDVDENEDEGEEEEEGEEEVAVKENAQAKKANDDNAMTPDAAPQTEVPPPRDLPDLIDLPLWSLTLPERMILHDYWITQWQDEQEEMFKENCAAYEKLRQEIKGYSLSCSLRALRGASVVGFTTSGAAAHMQLFSSLSPRIVICEEAGEVFESHILSSLTQNTQHLIMIGDHKQLRPKVEEYDLSVDSGLGYDLDLSLFERLVRAREDEFGNSGAMENGSLVTLETQRRMRPDISNLIRIPIYPSLQDASEVLNYPPVSGMARNLWFFNHDNPETGGKEAESRSYLNIFEAEMILVLIKHLVRQGYQPNQIAVLTPYAGQLLKLRDLLSKAQMAIFIDERTLQDLSKVAEIDDEDGEDLEQDGGDNDFIVDVGDDEIEERAKTKKKRQEKVKSVKVKDCVRLSTVDNFQGEEADVVIVSTVRNNRQGKTGFLQISNRVNVMMSRAKHGMYVFGSTETVEASRDAKVFREMLAELRKQNAIGAYLPLRCKRHGTDLLVASPSEFANKVPDGGCDQPCGTRLACGHACQRMCHPDDSQHVGFACRQPCTRLHSPCGHPCFNMCFQECGKCNTKVSVQLPCGHTAIIDCHRTKSISTVHCLEKVEVQYPLCGHKTTVSCGVAISLANRLTALNEAKNSMLLDPDPLLYCNVKCSTTQPHQQSGLSPPLPCGHACTQPCGRCCEATMRITDQPIDLSQPITKTHHSGVCSAPCNRTLVCGHLCAATTCHGATECPPCTKQCPIKCPHTKCGRSCVEPCPPCAEPCVWHCPHKGGCPLPCGAPCIRLPCDMRCTRSLACGHPCPSVCGEVCPPPDVACPKCALPNQRNSVVDLIEMNTLEAHDVNKDEPLVALECGHTFTLSTLDGTVGLDTGYKKNKEGKWEALVELPSKLGTAPSCPHCREPIANVRRYGRILAHAAMEQASIKFNLQTQHTCHQYAKFLAQYDNELREYEELDARNLRDVRDINDAREKMRFTCEKTRDLCANLKKFQPERRVYEMSVATLAKKSLTNIPPFYLPSSQPLIMALQISVTALTYKFRYDCLFFLSKITHHGERRGKGPQQNKSLEETVRDNLGRIRSSVENVCRLARELLKLCATSRSYRSLLDSQQLFVQFLFHAIHHTYKVARAARHDENSVQAIRQLPNFIKMMKEIIAEVANPDVKGKCELLVEAANTMLNSEHYETITIEEKRGIFTAMSAEVGTGSGSFGGHWFMCRQGHIYTIGECGGAMERAVCPECGSAIGGANHQREEGNNEATEFLGQVQARR